MHNLHRCLVCESIENECGGKYRAEAQSKNTCHVSLVHKVTFYRIVLRRDMTKTTQ